MGASVIPTEGEESLALPLLYPVGGSGIAFPPTRARYSFAPLSLRAKSRNLTFLHRGSGALSILRQL